MTEQQFIKHEVSIWGEDYIFSLVDRGYSPVLVFNRDGRVKWTWIRSSEQVKSLESEGKDLLTNAPEYATV